MARGSTSMAAGATSDDDRLRRIAVFDVVANNADRKGGHLLPTPDGRVQGIDHGVCFAIEPSCALCCGRGQGPRCPRTWWRPSRS